MSCWWAIDFSCSAVLHGPEEVLWKYFFSWYIYCLAFLLLLLFNFAPWIAINDLRRSGFVFPVVLTAFSWWLGTCGQTRSDLWRTKTLQLPKLEGLLKCQETSAFWSGVCKQAHSPFTLISQSTSSGGGAHPLLSGASETTEGTVRKKSMSKVEGSRVNFYWWLCRCTTQLLQESQVPLLTLPPRAVGQVILLCLWKESPSLVLYLWRGGEYDFHPKRAQSVFPWLIFLC